jgi:enhancing lycopene biosynthesis protein 2
MSSKSFLSKLLQENNSVQVSAPMGFWSIYWKMNNSIYYFNTCNGHDYERKQKIQEIIGENVFKIPIYEIIIDIDKKDMILYE